MKLTKNNFNNLKNNKKSNKKLSFNIVYIILPILLLVLIAAPTYFYVYSSLGSSGVLSMNYTQNSSLGMSLTINSSAAFPSGFYNVTRGDFKSLVFYNSNPTYWNTSLNIADTYSTRSGIVTANNEINLSEPSLVSYWKLDGDYLDAKGINNGTAQGTRNATGISSSSINFIRTSTENLSVGTSSTLNPTSGITLAGWVYGTGLNLAGGEAHTMIGRDVSGGRSYNFGIISSYGVQLQINGVNKPEAAGVGIPSNEWHHILTTGNASLGYRTYLDGALLETSTWTAPAATATTTYIGRRAYVGAQDYFNGSIDEVLVYSRGVTDAEVTQIYKSGLSQHANTNVTLQYRTASSYNISDPGLIGLWGFNADSATTVFDETGRNNGTRAGSIVDANEGNGTVGKGYKFDGVDDYVSYPNSIPSRNGTVTLWIKLLQKATYGDPIAAGTTNNDFRMYIDPVAGGSYYGFYISGEYRVSGNIYPPIGEWTYVTLAWNGSGTRLYFNGELQGQNTNAPPAFNQVGFNLGHKNGDAGGYFNGSIDEVRIYNRSLSADEIQNLYELGSYHINWDNSGAWSSEQTASDGVPITSPTYSKFMQFKINLNTNSTSASPYVTNHSILSYMFNYAPVISLVTLNSTNISRNETNQNLTAFVSASDVNNDNLTYAYNWYKTNLTVTNNLEATTLITDGLIAYYPLDNDVLDYSWSNNGTIAGAPVNNATNGKVANGYYFDGTDDKIILGNKTDLMPTNEIYLAAWVKSEYTGAYGTGIISKHTNGPSDGSWALWLSYNNNNKAQFLINPTSDCGGNNALESTTLMNDGRWHFIVAGYSNIQDNLTMYVDGVLENSVVCNAGVIKASNTVPTIAYSAWSSANYKYFKGSIDEVMVFNRTLSASEVRQLYYGGLAGGHTLSSNLTSWNDTWKVGVKAADYQFWSSELNSSNNITILDLTSPNATLNSPGNNSYLDNLTQNITANITDESSGIQNITLWVYNSTDLFNSTTLTGYAAGTLTASVGVVVNLVEGVYTWFYSLFDWAGNLFTSQNRTLTIDTTYPLVNFTNPTPVNNSGKGSLFYINASIIDVNLANVTLIFNGTSIICNTSSLTGNCNNINASLYNISSTDWVFIFNKTGLTAGLSYSYYINVTDKANNKNSTETRIVRGNNPPSLISLTYSPNINATLDPNTLVTFTANVSDAEYNFDTAILQWVNSSQGWGENNITMNNLSVMPTIDNSLIYTIMNASLNLPSYEDSLLFRVWFNDTNSQTSNSSSYLINNYWDCTWNITTNRAGYETTFDSASGWDVNKRIGNITISNTGDYNYTGAAGTFDDHCPIYFVLDTQPTGIRSSFLFNNSLTRFFTITTSQSLTLPLNYSFNTTQGSMNFNLTVTDDYSMSLTSQAIISGELLTQQNGPYLSSEVSYDDSDGIIFITPSTFNVLGYVKNIMGNDSAQNTAYNLTSYWIIPSLFTNYSGAINYTYETLANNSQMDQNLELNYSNLETMTQGRRYFYLITKGYDNSSGNFTLINYSNSNVTILNRSTSLFFSCYDVADGYAAWGCINEDPDTVACGNGHINNKAGVANETCDDGNTVSGDGCSSECIVETTTTTTTSSSGGGGSGGGASSNKKIERSSESFELVRGSNNEFILPIKNKYTNNLEKVNISVEGINSEFISLKPNYFSLIKGFETKEVKVKITAPAYFTGKNYSLIFTISGIMDLNGTTQSYEEYKQVTLYILEVSREETNDYMNNSFDLFTRMNQSGMNTKQIEELINSMNNAYSNMDFGLVRDKAEQVQTLYDSAIESDKLIKELTASITQKEYEGVYTSETKKLLYLAEIAFSRGDYALALSRIKEARLVFISETKGEFNLAKYVQNNPLQSLGYIFLVLFVGTSSSLLLRFLLLRRKLRLLKEEEILLLQLMKVIQRDCFENNRLSMEEYEQAMLQYEKKLSETVEDKIRVETKLTNLLKIRGKRKALEEEKKRLIGMIKQAQTAYLIKGKIETRIYENMMKSYGSRLGDVDEQLAFMDAQEAINKERGLRRVFRI